MSAVSDVFDPANISVRIAKGIQFATERGFIGKIIPETLDMSQNGRCMIGQGTGMEYIPALQELGISDDDATDMGFQCSDFAALDVRHDESNWELCPVYFLEQREFAVLTSAFRQAVSSR